MSRSKNAGLALAAGALAVSFFVAGTIALFTDDLSVRIFGVRVSMRTPWRPYFWGVVMLLARDWLVRQPPSFVAWVSTPFRRTTLARLVTEAKEPLPLEERELFAEPMPWPRRIGRLALLLLGFSALVIALTWPQIRQLESGAPHGDPQF
jgi:hypothetical protein